MLSMEEIVDILEPNQVMFDNELGGSGSIMQRKKKNLNEVYKMYLDMNEYEKIEYNKENSFIKSVLSILDHNFMMYDEKEKNNQVKLLFNKLYDDLDEQGLDKKFGYIRKKDLKKSTLKDILIKNKLDIDDIKYNNIKQYIADYFGVNIIMFLFDNEYNFIANKMYEYCSYKKDEKHPSVLNIIVEKYKDKYNAVIKTNDKYDDSVFRLSQNKEELMRLNSLIQTLRLEKEEEVEKIDLNEEDEEEIDYKNAKSLDKLKLEQLKEIAIGKDIKLKKLSEKTGKLINLKKKEIIDEIVKIAE